MPRRLRTRLILSPFAAHSIELRLLLNFPFARCSLIFSSGGESGKVMRVLRISGRVPPDPDVVIPARKQKALNRMSTLPVAIASQGQITPDKSLFAPTPLANERDRCGPRPHKCARQQRPCGWQQVRCGDPQSPRCGRLSVPVDAHFARAARFLIRSPA